ncbi:MAG TPA: Na+/H+ antiporter NhaA [Gemmatimonadales bacterium]|nr:Na+/H+ antiporter NhaA [Gemmatimonadales bacterium]
MSGTGGRAPSRAMGATPIERALRPVYEFARYEASSGLVLLACAAVALAWANSPWAGAYTRLWDLPISLGVGAVTVRATLHQWINDGLMAVFFFVVGLEIKREILVGELATPRRAALPLAAAVGGMAVPAVVYAALNRAGPGAAGWGIPMATDIAFALGVLALLGPRAPAPLRVFLTALAIVDDIGAVSVIALFYTADLALPPLVAAGALLVLLLGCNAAGVRHPAAYALLGIALWLAVLESGVHATVAGVLLALTIPARTRIDAAQFVAQGREALDRFAVAGTADADVLVSPAHQEAIQAIEAAAEAAQAPLQRLEDKLHGVVAFGIMPLFALANAGVPLAGGGAELGGPIPLGVILGLVLGKPLGITAFAWLATRLRLADRPAGVTWAAIHGAGWLGGIGFTMSLFIAGLAFDDPSRLTQAKLGILTASAVAGATGWLVLRRHLGPGPAAR